MVIVLKLGKERRIKFKLKSVVTFIIVSVIIASSALFMMRNTNIQILEENPVFDAYMSVGKHTNNFISDIGKVFSNIVNFQVNANKVKTLKMENDKLRKELIVEKSNSSKTDSLKELKRVLNYISSDERVNLISARIIGKNDGDWFKSFVIDAGADNGIRNDSIVINGDGVIGIVYDVSNKFSKAISLLDSRASVSFKVVGNDSDRGVITTSENVGVSSYKNVNKLLSGYMFDINSPIKIGDEIVTSGLGLYPENLPIGKVTDVIVDKNKSMRLVKIKPFVDFKSIDEVSIIPPRRLD